MKELIGIVVVVLVMIVAVALASCQRCIDVVRESMFDLLVIMAITCAGIWLIERATGQ